MSLVSQAEIEAMLVRVRKEMNDELRTQVIRLNNQLKNVQIATPTTASDSRPQMQNMTRNGDLRDSVDSRYNSVSAADNSRYECACVYAYPPLEPVEIADAEINAGSNILKALTSTPFTNAMVGRYVIVEGAGAGGAKFGAKINNFTNSGEVILSANAVTTVAAAAARINLQKLTHKNTKTNPGDAVNDALKDAAQTNYATNISDPDWEMNEGIGRLGKTNIVGFPFGYYSLADGTTYIPLHQLFPGRIVFVRVNIAKANQFVKVKGRMFFGIYNNSDLVLDWVRGGQFTVSATVLGNPASTVSANYLVVIATDSGYSLVSNILNVPNAPDLAAFNAGAGVKLNWNRFSGTIRTTVYRQLGTGNIFKLESDVFDREYTDTNHPARIDVGAAFPTIADAENKVFSYFATPENGLDELPDNSAGETWLPVEVFLAFPPSVNMAELFDPHLLIGLTEPLATEVADAIADGAGNISSVSGAFNAAMVGKNYTLRHQPTNQTATGTVTAFTDASHIALSSSPFAASGCLLEIEDSQPHGILFDLVGTALTEVSSDWAFHAEDLTAKQPSVANPPDGSNQGGIGGSDGYGGGIGRIECVLDETMITVRGVSNYDLIKKRADEVQLADSIWSGEGFRDEDFNRIKWIKRSQVGEILQLKTQTKILFCTKSHRVVTSPETKPAGIAVMNLMAGNELLISEINSSRIETIIEIVPYKGWFNVISLGLTGANSRTEHLLVCNDVQSHNRKELLD